LEVLSFKIALISPGPIFTSKFGKKVVRTNQLYPPLGILYLSAVLKRENFHVDVIDQAAYGFDLQQILNWIKRKDPDVLGFSTLISPDSSIPATVISSEIKKWNPNLKIVFGNKHATFNDDKILKNYQFVDVCVRYEGEYSFLELANAFSNNSSLKTIRGITYRENGKIRRNEDHEKIKDLDSVPFPDRKGLKFRYKASFGGLDLAPSGFTSILASRGCPFNCCYCYSKRTFGYKVRSVENVIEEMELLENDGYKFFIFIDDNFTLNKKWVLKLCSMMKKEKIDLDWICEGRVDQVSMEMLRAMRNANCRFIFFGIESANQRILDYYRKKITPHQSQLAVNKAREAGIPFIVGSFIVGAPGETVHEIKNTLKFSERLDIDFPFINILGTSPGTDVWDDLVKKGILEEDKYWETGVPVIYIDPKGVPVSKLYSLITESMRNFYLNPRKLMKLLFSYLTNSFKLRKSLQIAVHNITNFKNLAGVRSFAMGTPEDFENLLLNWSRFMPDKPGSGLSSLSAKLGNPEA